MAVATQSAPLWPGKDLYVNDGMLPANQVLRLKQTPLDTPIEEVRRRYDADGYVFIKGLLPKSDVLEARKKYFELLAPSGVLKPGSQPVEGIFDSEQDSLDYPGIGAGGADANGRPIGPHPDVADKFVELALQAHTEDWYAETFCKHQALWNYIADMTGWGENTLPLRRTLIRNNTPGNKAIGVHYDQIFLRHGEDTSVTAWVPMGDIAVEGGGLIYLEDGHKLGVSIETDFTERAKKTGLTDEETRNAFNANMMSGGMLAHGPLAFGLEHGKRWLVTDYEAGDVVLHKPYMIHASTMNHDQEGIIRVGTDLRYVDKSRPFDERWQNDYRFGDGV